MICPRVSKRLLRAVLVGAPLALALALSAALKPVSDPRVVGDWRGNAGGDPLLTLGRDGRYVSVNLTQTKTIPPEVGTYEVRPLPSSQAKGRLAGAEIVRLRHILPEEVARILHRNPNVVRDLVFIPGIPALVEGERDFVPQKDMAAAQARLVRWRVSR